VATGIDATSGQVASVDEIPEGTMALDIGPRTIELFGGHIQRAKTVFWNGPMGLFETPAFANGTFEVARIMSAAPGFTVVGGGDSAAAVKQAGEAIANGFDHISTGGGASLELIEGKRLPGIEALRSAEVTE
jgi:phosphoglycerate kinase